MWLISRIGIYLLPLPLTPGMCGQEGEKSERSESSLCAVHLLTWNPTIVGSSKYLSLVN